MKHFDNWMKVTSHLITLVSTTVFDETGVAVFDACTIIFLISIAMIPFGLFLISSRQENNSFEVNSSIYLIIGSTVATAVMGYFHFIVQQNDIASFVNLMNDVIPEAISDVEKLRKDLPTAQPQTVP